MKLIDGGYLAWTYGVDGGKINAWNKARKDYSRRAGALFLMDSPHSFRKDFFPEYKERRAQKREDDPEQRKRRDRVEGFKNTLRMDPSLAITEVHGLEADDLVAIAAYKNPTPPLMVIGVDKDLLQLGELITMEKHDGTLVELLDFIDRQPKTIQDYILTPMDVVYTLCLMGDKSDSIPRLIPPYQLDLFIQGITHQDRWQWAVREFGWDAVVTNLYIAILPSPWCFDVDGVTPSPEDVFQLVRKDRWPQECLAYFREDIIENLAIAMTGGYLDDQSLGDLSDRTGESESGQELGGRPEEAEDEASTDSPPNSPLERLFSSTWGEDF